MAGVEPYRSTGSGSRSTWVCGVPARFRKLATHRLGATSHEIAWRGASLHPGGRRFEPVTRPSPDSRADALAFVFSVEAFRSVWQQNGRHAIWRESGADPGARRVQGRTPPTCRSPDSRRTLNGACTRMGSRRLHGASAADASRSSPRDESSSDALGQAGCFAQCRPGYHLRVPVAASTVAVVAIAAAVIVVALLAFYVLPRGGRRKRPPRT